MGRNLIKKFNFEFSIELYRASSFTLSMLWLYLENLPWKPVRRRSFEER